MNLADLSVLILNARDRNPAMQQHIRATYEMWHSVWSEALQELDGVTSITSDDFTRHEEILTIFHKDQPIAAMFFSKADLSLPMWRRDSYFKVWPDYALDKFAELYPGLNVLICCQYTVAKEWRGDVGVSVKRLLAALTIEHFKASECRGMTGNTRKNKGIDKVSYAAGGQPLAVDVECHGVMVDLMYFDRDHAVKISPHVPLNKEASELYARAVRSGDQSTGIKIVPKAA